MNAPTDDLARTGIDPAALDRLALPRPAEDAGFDRAEGMLLGLAVGDSLGNTSEGQIPGDRRAAYGEIRDYRANRYAAGRAVGLPSDDTQLAFWTLEHLLERGSIVPEELAEAFTTRRIRGIGHSVRGFLAARREGRPWYEAAQRSAGNGALMRIAPVVLPHANAPSPALWRDVVLAAETTHRDPSSTGACVAFAGMLVELLGMPEPPEPSWWIEAYVSRARAVEGDAPLETRGGGFPHAGPIWRLVDTEVRRAIADGDATLDACNRWHSGAYLLETVPCALYLLARHAGDPEEAIVRAVNDTKDNDTVAAIVGAAVGALHGRRGLPERWLAGLLGRTTDDDDGRVFELLEAARARWGSNGSPGRDGR